MPARADQSWAALESIVAKYQSRSFRSGHCSRLAAGVRSTPKAPKQSPCASVSPDKASSSAARPRSKIDPLTRSNAICRQKRPAVHPAATGL